MTLDRISPDFDFWIKNGFWTLKEASLLLLNLEPRKFNLDFRITMDLINIVPEEVREKTEEMITLLSRGPFRGGYKELNPKKIIKWCLSSHIHVPSELMAVVNKLGTLNESTNYDYEHWLKLNSWSLEQAICLLAGFELDYETLTLPSLAEVCYINSDLERLRLEPSAIADNLRFLPEQKETFCKWHDIMNSYIGDDSNYVMSHSDDFTQLYKDKLLLLARELNLIVPKALIEAADRLYKENKTTASNNKIHGNSERFAKTREKILKAAFCLLANLPEKHRHKSNNKLNKSALVKSIDRNSELFFGSSEPPLSGNKIEELISEAMQNSLRNKIN